jgi:hypothetical protein
MAFSIMLWLVNPGAQMFEQAALTLTRGDHRAPGADQGINEPPAVTRLVYGVFENFSEAKSALEKIEKRLGKNRPISIELHGGPTFLVPAARVHYAVLSEAVRPKDKVQSNPKRGSSKVKT